MCHFVPLYVHTEALLSMCGLQTFLYRMKIRSLLLLVGVARRRVLRAKSKLNFNGKFIYWSLSYESGKNEREIHKAPETMEISMGKNPWIKL